MTQALTHDDIEFFKAEGYLIKKGAIPKAQCEHAMDRMWESAPESIKRDDPATWQPISGEQSSADPLLVKMGTRWQYRAIGTEKWLLDLAYSPKVVNWAEQLLGAGTLRIPTPGGKPMGSWGAAWPGGPSSY